MIPAIRNYCEQLVSEFGKIEPARKVLLERLAAYITSAQSDDRPVHLLYICTHNSRRSHFGQVWAKVASAYYKIPHIYSYSGGTEATAFNGNAIGALRRVGFRIEPAATGDNPTYQLVYDETKEPVKCFSKVYDHPVNPQRGFAAIMTCSDAEENCPFIPGADLRIATTYDDPKAFDGTDRQNQAYDERCRQIARETMYVFSKIKNSSADQ